MTLPRVLSTGFGLWCAAHLVGGIAVTAGPDPLRVVGTLLVLALLLAPPATARLLAPRVATMLWLSPLLGVASGVAGLYLSYYADLAASPSIALVAIGLFVLALGVAPARRLVARPRAAATAATGA